MKVVASTKTHRLLMAVKVIAAQASVALTASSTVFFATPSRAILNYRIFQSGPNVVMDAKGTLALPQSFDTCSGCAGPAGGLISHPHWSTTWATGPSNLPSQMFKTTSSGSTSFPYIFIDATSTPSSIGTIVAWDRLASNGQWGGVFWITNPDIANIDSSSFFANKSLAADFGLTTPGLVASLTLLPAGPDDPYTANDTINIYVDPPRVPAPLPLIGLGTACAVARRLRRRVLAVRDR